MATTIGNLDAVSTKTGHKHLGPPAVSMIPPMAPPTPPGIPAPFVYLGKSSTAKSTSSKLKIKGGPAVLIGKSKLSVDMPGNQPAQATTKKDLVTSKVNSKVVI